MKDFHPAVTGWFGKKFGKPTEIQEKSWETAKSGKHLLINAPTGSGKTMAAFLWALNQFYCGKYPPGECSVLYISPLKALNNDIGRNLTGPLKEIEEWEEDSPPRIHVSIRSGDTPQKERQKVFRRHPEILITTPESLNILLSSKSGLRLLENIRTVILDEIHAVFSSKRGVHLMTAVERLTRISGEFQRIAVSATVCSAEVVRRFVGGYQWKDGEYHLRQVEWIKDQQIKKYDLSIHSVRPNNIHSESQDKNKEQWWSALVKEWKKLIRDNRSVLFFVNNRRMAEKVARMLNEDEEETLAYSHHGSLSREIRYEVEKKMKEGSLKAIVATASLELGIDIGEIDTVVLIQTPMSIHTAVQRIGRSNHQVGKKPKAVFFPLFPLDILQSAAVCDAMKERRLETMRIMKNPLDVLSQVILSVSLIESVYADDLYTLIRQTEPYHDLDRRLFDSVLEMLAGKYAHLPVRELKPVVYYDQESGLIKAVKESRFLLYFSGGTIPERGYYRLKTAKDGQLIGELDEEFVWERKAGDTFAMGSGVWRITAIKESEVEVLPVSGFYGIIPFWNVDNYDSSTESALNFAEWLEQHHDLKESSDYPLMNQSAYQNMKDFFSDISKILKGQIPHRHRIVIEIIKDPNGLVDRKQAVIHTFWGSKVNRALSMAMTQYWAEEFHYQLEIFFDAHSLILNFPHDFEMRTVFSLITESDIKELIRKRLPFTGFFGGHFRQCAQLSLMLPKGGPDKRMPLWMNRIRARRLFETVSEYHDFPVTYETYRECIEDGMEIQSLLDRLDEIENGEIEVCTVSVSEPSALCEGILWRQTNQYMYEDDKLNIKNVPQPDLLESVLVGEEGKKILDPSNPEDLELISRFESKIQWKTEGYQPDDIYEVKEYLNQRQLIPEEDFSFFSALADESGFSLNSLTVLLKIGNAEKKLRVEKSSAALIRTSFHQWGVEDDEGLPIGETDEKEKIPAAEWIKIFLRFYGPVKPCFLNRYFGLSSLTLIELLNPEPEILIYKIDGIQTMICDRQNFERLLRIRKKERQSDERPLSLDFLPWFLARIQGINGDLKESDDEFFESVFEKLLFIPLPAELWETKIFKARFRTYRKEMLDEVMKKGLIWTGAGKGQTAFMDREGRSLWESGETAEDELFPSGYGRYSVFDIQKYLGIGSQEVLERLWKAVWNSSAGNDHFETVRKAVLNRFKIETAGGEGVSRIRRGRGFAVWKSSRISEGLWFSLKDTPIQDPLEYLEIRKDRARILIDRYGILFRELLMKEHHSFQWREIFPALRVLELSGEIISGIFFEEISGLQFMNQKSYREWTKISHHKISADVYYCMNAMDPASICGLPFDTVKNHYPRRVSSNELFYHGEDLLMIIGRNGKSLEFCREEIRIEEIRQMIFQYQPLRNPKKNQVLETVQSEPVFESVYAGMLQEAGFKKHYKGLEWPVDIKNER